jgi:multidrug efflux pump subunit AcrB
LIVDSNVMVGPNPKLELGSLPVKLGPHPVLLRDVASIDDIADQTTSYVLVNGKRAVYLLVTKRAEASTLAVVDEVKKALPKMRDAVPQEIKVEFAFDQSPIVREAVTGVVVEGALGAILTGLMVLLFLRDWRSVIVVVLNIPLALCAAVFALWVTGQTVNLMTLGGLALAVGILVDEATVEVENIHTQMARHENVARAVRLGNIDTAVPRLLAMLCILAVFIPSFFMRGAARELFVPLSLAVGFSMIASYILSSTFVPVMSVWLLKPMGHGLGRRTLFDRLQDGYEAVVARVIAFRAVLVPAYLLTAGALVYLVSTQLGTAVFPPTDQGQFLLRLKAPSGTEIKRTEQLVQEATRLIHEEAGAGNVTATVGYVGLIPSQYPVQGPYQWMSGPEECVLKVSLRQGSGLRVEEQKERLRAKLDKGLKVWLAKRWAEEGLNPEVVQARLPGLRLSFEPADVVSEVMSFGAPTPVEVQVSGSSMPTNVAFARTLREKLAAIPELRDVQLNPAQDYPTVEIRLDRMKAATMGLTARQVGYNLIAATTSTRFTNPVYWRDPGSGQAYMVQVQIPPPQLGSLGDIGMIPIRGASVNGSGMAANTEGHAYGAGRSATAGATAAGTVFLQDVLAPGGLRETTGPEEVLRYNMRRSASITANVGTQDLGKVRAAVLTAIAEAGTPPRGVNVDLRGQLNTLEIVQSSLTQGLLAAVVAIFLLLTAYFQSIRLSLVAVSAIPATLLGVTLSLWLTQTTLNLQSFMGAIMALGVSVANAILLVTFAERARLMHGGAIRASVEGGRSRLRPILMTSCAMIAGMVPMAIGFGAGGDQTAPLGRAVVGGLAASTLATLLVLPAVFAVAQRKATVGMASLDPDDPRSGHYDESRVDLFER